MKKEYILFIDSGVGGLSTLAESMKCTPANYIYFADNLHSPYGDHKNSEIFEFLKSIIRGLTQKYLIKIVVLACNTATTSSIKNLRTEFKDLVFVGTEPAIKLASAGGAKKVLCLATPTTAKQVRLKTLEKQSGCRVKTLAMPTLALDVERQLLDASQLPSFMLKKDILKIKNAARGFDAVVLGCTHYCLIKGQIEQSIHLPIYDGNFGVAQQIAKLSNFSTTKSTVKFIFSKNQGSGSQKYRKILNQILANQNNLC